MNSARLIPSVLLLAWTVSAAAQTGSRTTTDANSVPPMALKGKLLFADDFRTPAEYTKQLQPAAEGWRVRTAHANWDRGSEGVRSSWISGHMPVLAYEGTFRDAVIEVDFRFHREEGKWGGCRISATNAELNPRAYAASVWANSDGSGHDRGRPQGLLLEHDEWSAGPEWVANKMAAFESDTWYTLRLELIGDKAQATCHGVTVYGTHEKFGLMPKTSLWLGVGTCPHELRNLRVYEATLNPAWKAPASPPVLKPAQPAPQTGAAPAKISAPAAKTDDLTVGWTPAPLKFDIQKAWDVDVKDRYRYDAATGTHTLWILKGDKPHAPPPNRTGPRAELRFRNDYLTGEHMFDADVYIVRGTTDACVMQIWGSGLSATTMMIHVRQGGRLECGGGVTLKEDAYDKWFNLKVMHNPAGAGEVKIYIDNILAGTRPGRGFRKDGGGFYFKCGVYGLKGDRAEARFRNIKLWEKPAPSQTKSKEEIVSALPRP